MCFFVANFLIRNKAILFLILQIYFFYSLFSISTQSDVLPAANIKKKHVIIIKKWEKELKRERKNKGGKKE